MPEKPKILVLHEGRHGQTAKIAARIGDAVEARGVEALVAPLENAPREEGLADFDLVALGASVHFGRHPKAAVGFVRDRLEVLSSIPTAFFSVSGHAADGTPDGDALARGYVDDFLAASGWSPDRVASFAGAVRFTRYNVLLRFVMKRIQQQAGRSVDTSRDHEYTDWGAVEDFGRELVRLASRDGPTSSATPGEAVDRSREPVGSQGSNGSENTESQTA